MPRPLTELERKKALKLNHHKKIDYALAKAFIHDNDLYDLISDFFREYLDLKYEFTHEELTHELDKMYIKDGLKKNIIAFLDRIAYLQFNAQEKPSQDELRKLILSFKRIINELISSEEAKPQSFLEKVQSWVSNKAHHESPKESNKAPSEAIDTAALPPAQEETKPQDEPLIDVSQLPDVGDDPAEQPTKQSPPSQEQQPSPLKQLQQLIMQANQLLDQQNIPDARQTYQRLLELYNTAPPQIKQQYYHDVQVVFYRLK